MKYIVSLKNRDTSVEGVHTVVRDGWFISFLDDKDEILFSASENEFISCELVPDISGQRVAFEMI